MGKPAARCTDRANTCNDPVDAPVGTVIAVGTVLINNLPAAKQGDQIVGVDTHIIMIPAPPGPPIPTPLPHPFVGMLNGALSSSVKIMGMPAATVDSTASAMPPHIPQGGPFQKPPGNEAKIILGSPNVMIGNGGGGGGGGSGRGSQTESTVKATPTEANQGHYLKVSFVDKGGKPVRGGKYLLEGPDGKKSDGNLTGRIERIGVVEGSHEITLCAITKATWSVQEAAVGDKVKMEIRTIGVESGEKARLEIYIKDANFADHLFDTIEAEVDSDKIEHEWELMVDDKLCATQDSKDGKNYSNPYYYFAVQVAGLKQRSGLLRYKDWLELEATGEDGKALANAIYNIKLPNGSIITGSLDANGYAKVENLPPGRIDVEYDIRASE